MSADGGPVCRLCLIAARLANAGFAISMHETRAGLELQAVLRHPIPNAVLMHATDDGHVEFGFWADPDASPDHVASALIAAATCLRAVQAKPSAFLRRRLHPFGPVTRYDGSVTQRVGVGGMAGAPDRLVEQERIPDAERPHETPDVRQGLRERLERLPPGHPSSPYESDGSPKPPIPDPAARERPFPNESSDGSTGELQAGDSQLDLRPLTDIEYANHVQEVRDRLSQARADGLATNVQYTEDVNHAVWAKDRLDLHKDLIEDLYAEAAKVPCDHNAIIAGGLPGAGKSTVLHSYAGIDRSKFLTINPDDIKDEMARRDLIPRIDGLSPMEASDLSHEESSLIAKGLARRAQGDGKNLIWDITMSSLDSTQTRINDLRDNGYTNIQGIFVNLPIEVSAQRATDRHRNGLEKYRSGEGEGGRFIPPEAIEANADPEWGSMNRRTFEAIKTRLDTWSIYDNSVDGGKPVLIAYSPIAEKDK